MKIKKMSKYILIFLIVFFMGFFSQQFFFQTKSIFNTQSVIAEDHKFKKEYKDIQENLKIAQELSEAFSYIAEKAAPAVVYIETEKVVSLPLQMPPFHFFMDPFFKRFFSPPKFKERGAGSGFIISSDGYIVTNNHVIQGAEKIIVKLADGRVFKAKVIGTDPYSDIALIKINAKNLPTLPLGNSDNLKIGEWVIAIGNPFGLTHTVTTGVISAKGRSGIGISDIEDFIQTDAAINPGNSGGPLLNLRGEVVGMNTAIFTRSGGYMGIGFAIPINIVKNVVEQLKTKGKVERGYLGVYIQDLNPAIAEALGIKVTKGALITEVIPNSPAEKAGLKVKDVIIKYNDKEINNASDLKTYILLTKPGTVITLTIIRDGKIKKIKVKIESPDREVFFLSDIKRLNEFLSEIGIKVEEITPALAKKLKLPSNKGVVITEIIPETPADYARLTPGLVIDEVNKKKIADLKDFYMALKPSLRTKKVLFGIKTRHGRYYITLSLD